MIEWIRAGRFAAVLVLCLAGCAGCDPTPPDDVAATKSGEATSQGGDDEPASVIPLKLLIVDDPPLARAIARQWEAMTGKKLDVVEQTTQELEAHAGPLDADIVLYPTGLLGTLAERKQIVPLPEDVAGGKLLRRGDQLEMTRLRETVWGETPYAAPLGTAQFVLFYRRDLLEKLGASPPSTWAEYQALAEKLATRPADESPSASATERPWNAVAEPSGPGWGGLVLLARAAAYARHRSQYSTTFDFTTLEPRLTSAPFVRALEELTAAAKLGAQAQGTRTPQEARRAILAGECGLALGWLGPARDEAAGDGASPAAGAAEESLAGQIAIAALPGSPDVFNASQSKWEQRGPDEPTRVSLLTAAGRLGSVTSTSRQARGAFNFLAMLSAGEWHTKVVTASREAGLYRNSHVDAPAVWVEPNMPLSTATEYAKLVRQMQRDQLWLAAPRIPGRSEYLAALDEAVAAAVAGQATPAEALRTATEQWEKITDSRGREEQKRAYRRCLGLEK